MTDKLEPHATSQREQITHLPCGFAGDEETVGLGCLGLDCLVARVSLSVKKDSEPGMQAQLVRQTAVHCVFGSSRPGMFGESFPKLG